MSQKYSEGLTNALQAKKIIAKENPSLAQKIHIMNSKTVGPILKYLIKQIIKFDTEGKKLEEIIGYINHVSNSHRSYVYLDTLKYLRKSNRINRVTAFFGSLLGIKPIIVENLKNQGDLNSIKNVRNKDAGRKEIINLIKQHFDGQ
jgi:DegV family protein with EDD domain